MSDDLEKRVKKLEKRVDEIESNLREVLRVVASEQVTAFQEEFQKNLDREKE